MLDLVDLKKTFQTGASTEQIGLDGLSLKLEKGEFVTVIGSNGAGKSTMFNAIAGSIMVDAGKISLDGQDITYAREHSRAKQIGRIFQDPATGTAPNLSIEENLALAYSKATGRFPLKIALRSADRARFREALSRYGMGLENRLKERVGLLSGGQRQALALLLATLVTPKLLLLDEHTTALDPVAAEKIMRLTSDIVAENGITTLMITHNISSALEMGTRTVTMDRGKIVMDLHGEERKNMNTYELLQLYRSVTQRELDNDRMLFSGREV